MSKRNRNKIQSRSLPQFLSEKSSAAAAPSTDLLSSALANLSIPTAATPTKGPQNPVVPANLSNPARVPQNPAVPAEDLEQQIQELREKETSLKELLAQQQKQQEEMRLQQQEWEQARQDLERLRQEKATEFVQLRRTLVGDLEDELKKLIDQQEGHLKTTLEAIVKHVNNLADSRTAMLKENHVQQTEQHDKFMAFTRKYNQEVQELDEMRLALESQRRNLERRENFLARERQDIEATAREEARSQLARQVQKAEFRAQGFEQQVEELREENLHLQEEVRHLQTRLSEHDSTDIHALKQQLREAQKNHRKLEQELTLRPSLEVKDQLDQVLKERDQWQEENWSLRSQLNALQLQQARSSIAVHELETLRDARRFLETRVTVYKTALDELKADVDLHIKAVDDKTEFPALTQMDRKEHLQVEAVGADAPVVLRDWVKDLQLQMAFSRQQEMRRKYTLTTVRSFISGMAMTQLHLLQGISGTGKTSLPLALSRAMQGGSRTIAVQSGWRDKTDLLGHYNAFERKFYESEFIQALYEAQCPAYQDRPYFIVLDEMNLSHPEHYFADVLSKLELSDPGLRVLPLLETSSQKPPRLLVEGKALRIPPNVWFVGTANHDETTKDFADKTYDRSHVMELPRSYATINEKTVGEATSVSHSSLQEAFHGAVQKHRATATQWYTHLEQGMGAFLQSEFDLSWGNRLHKQMEHFIPVYMATGESHLEKQAAGEALDLIFASKVLRKLQNKFGISLEALVELKDHLDVTFQTLPHPVVPQHSLGTLKDLQHKLGLRGDL